ncbi:MAG: VPLPA-CTERM sorting domain-containing protein [Gammaproteobacteria bacterium]
MKYLRMSASELPGSVTAPWGPQAFARFFIGALLATLTILTFPNSAHAALIGLEAAPGSPIISTTQTFIDYDYTGSGGTLTIASYATDGKGVQTLSLPASSRWGTVTDEVFPIRDPGATGGTTDWQRTTFELIANFDAAGVFTTGAVTITGAVDTVVGFGDSTIEHVKPFDPALAGPCFGICGAGDLLRADLLGFGFKAEPDATGDHDGLQMDWYMNITGGDFFTAGWGNKGERTDIGVIAFGLVTWGDGLTSANNGSFDPLGWEVAGSGSTAAFLEDFRSCDNCEVLLQTFVPVPAAVWLFGSGLLGLTGVGMRNRRRNRSAG